ncbi:MAG: DUF4493 domain-containing protein [Muribaculaceae bacterium]|nr:DUF4493 domain-containing protein [Muribaculaceae bacterium]MDE6793674.1 DUF4493 domain-containing protein [Muribaculaceae bacterium]
MNLKNIYSLLGGVFLLTGCASEAPFQSERGDKDGMGEFRKSSLNLDVVSGDGINVITRAGEENVNINDFKIHFRKDGILEKTIIYKDMPDVVMLDPGVYRITARYNDDEDAAWDNPVFEGTSGEFSVTAGSITSDIDPIKCVLMNVKVSIVFDQSLINEIGEDGYIEVKLGNNGFGLQYKKTETRTGYFRIGSEKTLIATFHGTINGAQVTETKSLQDVAAGTHYQVTFKLHNHNTDNNGTAPGTVSVDASVNYENIENNITVKDELLTDESERPKQDDPNNPDDDDPNNPGNDDPVTPPSDEGGPTVTGREPINIDDWNVAVEGLACVLDVHSETGITGFTVKINSATLTNDVLTGVGLASEFDLISCKTADGVDVKDGLADLGLPVAEQVENQKDVVFDVSQFMGLLGIYGAADHKFILTITDASGTTVKELKLRTM